MEQPIGFIGPGAMGMPMARRLAGAGHRLIVSDTDPAARQRAGDVAGVEVAPGAGAAVAGVGEVVITCLPDPAEAEAVYGGIARAGLGEGEVAAVARVVEERAGVSLRRGRAG